MRVAPGRTRPPLAPENALPYIVSFLPNSGAFGQRPPPPVFKREQRRRKSQAMDSAPTAALYRRGNTLWREHHTEEAIHFFVDVLLLDPDHLPALLALGGALSEARRWDEALRVYEHAARRFPDVTVARIRLQEVRNQRVDRRAKSRAPERRRSARLASRRRRPAPGRSAEDASRWQAQVFGGAGFLFILATYAGVGLATHWGMGLLAAALLVMALAATGGRLIPPNRSAAFRSILRGMMVGLGVVLALGIVSIILALNRAAGSGW